MHPPVTTESSPSWIPYFSRNHINAIQTIQTRILRTVTWCTSATPNVHLNSETRLSEIQHHVAVRDAQICLKHYNPRPFSPLHAEPSTNHTTKQTPLSHQSSTLINSHPDPSVPRQENTSTLTSQTKQSEISTQTNKWKTHHIDPPNEPRHTQSRYTCPVFAVDITKTSSLTDKRNGEKLYWHMPKLPDRGTHHWSLQKPASPSYTQVSDGHTT